MTELRNFEGTDFYAWQGADNFADGSTPYIADGEKGVMIVCGSETKDGTAVISIYFDIDEQTVGWGFKSIDNKDLAIKDAKILMNLLNDEIDADQLRRFGFTVVC